LYRIVRIVVVCQLILLKTIEKLLTNNEYFAIIRLREIKKERGYSMATVGVISPSPKLLAAIRRISATKLPASGTFTVVGPKGGRRTLRFKEGANGFFAGKTIVSYLSGSDNERSYTGFANIDGDFVRVWRKYADAIDVLAALAFLAQGPEVWRAAGEAYAIESGSCYRCNRTLTVPASIHRGLGPECAKVVGGVA
jgi:hypothetical protein